MRLNLLVVLAAVGAVVAAGTSVAAPQWSAANLFDCAAEKDAAKRLACFDAEAERVGPRPPQGAPPAAVAAAVAAPPPTAPQAPVLTPEEEFGLRGDLKQEKLPQLQKLDAAVTEVRTKPRGELVVTLDNGQVWSENAPYSGIRVKVGERVRIEAGALQSFVLVAPNGRSSRVTRIR